MGKAMWVYYDKANGSLLFLLEFNLKVFRENNTTISFADFFRGQTIHREKRYLSGRLLIGMSKYQLSIKY